MLSEEYHLPNECWCALIVFEFIVWYCKVWDNRLINVEETDRKNIEVPTGKQIHKNKGTQHDSVTIRKISCENCIVF